MFQSVSAPLLLKPFHFIPPFKICLHHLGSTTQYLPLALLSLSHALTHTQTHNQDAHAQFCIHSLALNYIVLQLCLLNLISLIC